MPVAPDLRGAALDRRYVLHELIGEGAFGRVYRGTDERLERPVAVKVIKPWWGEDPAWVAVFEREARLLARLSDPGIVQIFDVGHAPEGLYYVSELVAGENLADRLRRGPLPLADALQVAGGLCRALGSAHAQRIVHRDVKPGNVLIAAGGRVKLGDFGVARLAEGTTAGPAASLVVGTPRYMAPEQGQGLATTPATDVYAAGVVLYEMLAGAPPFTAASPVGLALCHLQDPPPPLPQSVPRGVAAVVARALAKEPADRFADGASMGAALAASLHPHAAYAAPDADADAPAADPPGAATRPAPRLGPRHNVDPAARRRSIALLGLAGAALGALVAGAILVGGGSGGAHGSRGARGREAAAVARSVEVPLLVQESEGDAVAALHARGLHAHVREVAAPGIRPGTVTDQSPVAGHTVRGHGTVTLSVSEVPRWHTVATFAGTASGPVTIRGERWRVITDASHTSHCAVLGLFCHGSNVSVLRGASGGSGFAGFGLGDGSGAARVFDTGPGVYRVDVAPASGDTRWSITVQDDY